MPRLCSHLFYHTFCIVCDVSNAAQEEIRDTHGETEILVAYGSETGNAERVASQLASQLAATGFVPRLEVLGDLDLDDLTEVRGLEELY